MTMHDPELGAQRPQTLADERLQLHYGAWILGSVAHSVLPHADDDSHSNLGWDPNLAAFVTQVLDPETDLRLQLVAADLTLAFVDRDGQRASRQLVGSTFDDALAWCAEQLPKKSGVARRAYPDFPDSPLAAGAPFTAGGRTARYEIAAWYTHALTGLQTVVGGVDGPASAIRVWPHHFDLGVLIPLSDDGARGIGMGMTPGDGHHDEPYLYAYAYPTPPASAFAKPSVGSITTEGFTGPLALAHDLLAEDDPPAAVRAWFSDAERSARAALAT